VCWSIVVKEKPAAGSPFLRAFAPDCIPEAVKDVSVHFFIHNFTFRDELLIDNTLAGKNSCKLY
jgi:hypothetical protein